MPCEREKKRECSRPFTSFSRKLRGLSRWSKTSTRKSWMTFCFCAGNDTTFFPFSGHFLCKFLCVIERHGRSIRLSKCIHNKKAAKTSRFVLATATALFAPVQFLAGAWPQSGLHTKPMCRSAAESRALRSLRHELCCEWRSNHPWAQNGVWKHSGIEAEVELLKLVQIYHFQREIQPLWRGYLYFWIVVIAYLFGSGTLAVRLFRKLRTVISWRNWSKIDSGYWNILKLSWLSTPIRRSREHGPFTNKDFIMSCFESCAACRIKQEAAQLLRQGDENRRNLLSKRSLNMLQPFTIRVWTFLFVAPFSSCTLPLTLVKFWMRCGHDRATPWCFIIVLTLHTCTYIYCLGTNLWVLPQN